MKHFNNSSTPFPFLTAIMLLSFGMAMNAHSQSLAYKKIAQPAVDASNYTHIAIGDIVGATGTRTQNSMNLSDELTTSLMSKGSHEILDRNVLMQLRRSGTHDAEIVDESILSSIGEQYQSAVLILGRIQSDGMNQELRKVEQSIVINGCHTQYYYETSGDFTVQLRIVDAKTAKLIHADAVSVPMVYESERACEIKGKMNEDLLMNKAIAAMREKILNVLLPYEVNEPLYFLRPLFANPFKDTNTVAVNFETGNVQKGLEILKNHTTSSDTKEKHRYLAFYNYGTGLLADHQYQAALDNFIKAYELNPSETASKNMIEFTQKEMKEATIAATY